MLICRETGLEIVGRETDTSKVMERIQALRPNVVIVDGADRAGNPLAEVMQKNPDRSILALGCLQ